MHINIEQMGLINVDVNLSGGQIPRWVPMFAETYLDAGPFSKTLTYYQIALQLARASYGLPTDSIKRYDDRIEMVDGEGNILINIPVWEKQMLEVNYFSKWYSEKNTRYGMFTVAQAFALLSEGDEEQKAEAERFFSDFNDAIVMIGPTDPLLQDIAPSPFDDSPVPKVGVHGNVVKTIFSGLYIQRMPRWVKIALTFLLTVLVAMMVTTTGKSGTTAKLGGGLFLLGYVFIVFWQFTEYHRVIPLITPFGSAISASLIGAMVQLLIEEKQKGRIKGMFGTYLSPELVTSMIESGDEPQLGGKTAEVSAYFSDVQSFSAFSEKLSPEQLVDLMNEYLTAMTDILMDEGCYVDKYIGDAIVGIFNAPVELKDHALKACVSSRVFPTDAENAGRAEGKMEDRGGQMAAHREPDANPHGRQHGACHGRQHGLGKTLQLHHDGGHREPGRPLRKRSQSLWRLHHGNGGNQRGGGKVWRCLRFSFPG